MESPPKRMTRARAAAKASEGTVKTTKIVTAAARAKSTVTASTKSTAAKRKTRADEHEEDEEEQREVPAARRRGRPKKTEEPAEAPVPAKTTRVRAARKTTTEPPKEESVVTKPTRGRPRKVVAAAPAEDSVPEPAKKTTRARVVTTSRTTIAKSTTKKSVTFQEPDKENIEPAIVTKEPVRAGLRGRPAKRGGAVGSRTTRAAVRTATTDKKPLSPKKITQISMSKDDSEDELAGDSTPLKPMMKHPIKPPTTKKTEPAPAEEEMEEATTNPVLNPPDLCGGAMASPARRLPSSPLKDTMKSPARRIGPVPLPGSTMKPAGSITEGGNIPSFKASLLQSAAKRPPSPIKGLNTDNPSTSQHPQSAMKASLLLSPAKRALPGMMPLTEPRQRDFAALGDVPIMKPLVLSTPVPASARPSDKLMMEDQSEELEDPFTGPMESLQFPGRLSAVLPRHADPAWKKDMGIVDEPSKEGQHDEATETTKVVEIEHDDVDAVKQVMEETTEAADQEVDMAVDEAVAELEEAPEESESDVDSPSPSPQPENPVYQLRDKDLDPYHNMESESEDELESLPKAVPMTPTPFAQKTPKTKGTQPKASRVSLGGFTALAERFGSWSAASPIKMAPLTSPEVQQATPQVQTLTPSIQASPHYFDDEMTVRLNAEAVAENQENAVEEPSFDDIMVTEEDVALAHEANEMSLLEPEMFGSASADPFDDSVSEASQEYGDENSFPVDPAMVNSHSNPPITPVRPVMKSFNTTTKVPLKPADDSTPSPLKKRSFTASRVAPKRPTGPSRSATVISYSPMKERKSLPVTNVELASAPATPGPITPSKADLWSSMGTPARTPRRDVNPALLRGAVVFVDVHTSEGADASSIFVELLAQMGAKCLKTWTWNPSGGGEVSSSKVGITHVVYKDGGKRTLEKVRQANGVVQCVGVSWVLDCERENEWLEEAPYCIDTKVMPRGGARRRKSMEPKALANMNGTLVSSPVKGSRSVSGTPITPKNRRESATWVYTPSERDDEEMEDDPDWSNLMLTPVPKTPAPDAIARYAANIGPETPSGEDEEDMNESPTKNNLLTRTCPPKRPLYQDLGAGALSPEKDEQVLLRLMAARRKSLQFAPKIGSPLARAWK